MSTFKEKEMEPVDLGYAHPFYALAKDGKLALSMYGTPYLYENFRAADKSAFFGEEVVKVYLVVEDE